MTITNAAPGPTCRVVTSKPQSLGKQNLLYAPGISAETVGAQGIHLQIVTLPPGARAKAHRHEGHETALYVLSGETGLWFGGQLGEHVAARAGDYLYVPADVPHLPYNPSATDACVAIIARSDPNEQESVVLMPELDDIHR